MHFIFKAHQFSIIHRKCWVDDRQQPSWAWHGRQCFLLLRSLVFFMSPTLKKNPVLASPYILGQWHQINEDTQQTWRSWSRRAMTEVWNHWAVKLLWQPCCCFSISWKVALPAFPHPSCSPPPSSFPQSLFLQLFHPPPQVRFYPTVLVLT